MRNSRRNIPDPISPQNPVIKKDIIDEQRIQDKLEDKTPVEDVLKPVDNTKSDVTHQRPRYRRSNDQHLGDES